MDITQILGIYLLFSFLRSIIVIAIGFLYSSAKLKVQCDYAPLVSVVIPAWNEEIGIKKTVQSVFDSTYSNLEIIVVDDGSTDKTLELLKVLSTEYPKLRFIHQENKGKANALNTGINNSKGEIIITIDADSYIDENAIQRLIEVLSNNNYDAAIGSVTVANENNFLASIQYFEYRFGFHLKKTQSIFNSIYILPGALTAVRKSIALQVNLFEDYSKTEDFDFSLKLKSIGSKIVYIEDAICYTEGASTINGLINQRTRWRHGFLQCILKRKNFILNRKKGIYLTYIEFPLALWGIIDILLYPLFLSLILIASFNSGSLINIFLFYIVMPYAFFLISEPGKEPEKFKKKNQYIQMFMIPIMFTVVNIIEFIALMKALYRLFTRRETSWTNWTRVGI